MARVVYWNVAKVGKSSAPEKRPKIVEALRNWWMWWPDLYLFSEVSRAWIADFTRMGDLAHDVLYSNWHKQPTGCRYHVIDPHVQSKYSSEGTTEAAAIVVPNNVAGGQSVFDTTLLTVWNPAIQTNRNPEYLPGVRRPAHYAHGPYGAHVFIHHPSPTAHVLSFKAIVKALQQEYAAHQPKAIVAGDFNIEPNDSVGDGRTADQYAREHGLVLSAPRSQTHADGTIDFVVHTPNVRVSEVHVLDRDRAASDHYPIYFDYSA